MTIDNMHHARQNKKPPMKDITQKIEWEYAPHYIYQKYGYSIEDVIQRNIPTWQKLQEKHDITINSPKEWC